MKHFVETVKMSAMAIIYGYSLDIKYSVNDAEKVIMNVWKISIPGSVFWMKSENGYFTWNMAITSKAIHILDQFFKRQYI